MVQERRGNIIFMNEGVNLFDMENIEINYDHFEDWFFIFVRHDVQSIKSNLPVQISVQLPMYI